MKMGAGSFWSSYIKKSNYELLERECGTDPKIFDSINLNIDYLKIDGSLVKNLDKDENIKIVVSSIIYFAKQLNIPTIAEFVHSKEILNITRQLGFNYFQGFYLGGPQREILQFP